MENWEVYTSWRDLGSKDTMILSRMHVSVHIKSGIAARKKLGKVLILIRRMENQVSIENRWYGSNSNSKGKQPEN